MPSRASWTEPKKHTIQPSARLCAGAIGMNPRTFADHAAVGIVAPRADGKWDTRVVCKALAEHDDSRAKARVTTDPKHSEALERGREVRADLLQLELDTLRGKVVDRDAVHCAMGEVVGVHKAGLMALPKLGAVELANQTPVFIEEWLDRWARRFAGEVQETWDRLPFLAAGPEAKTEMDEPKPGPKATRKRRSRR